MDDDKQTHEEALAHVHGDAVGAAQLYIESMVKYGRVDAAQSLMTPGFRLARAQIWLWNNREHPDFDGADLDALAHGLVSGDPTAPFWPDFALGEVSLYTKAVGDWWERMGTASRPRPVSPGLEVVLFVDMDELGDRGAQQDEMGYRLVDSPTGVVNHMPVLVETRNGVCYVAGHGEEPHTPGWPPSGY